MNVKPGDLAMVTDGAHAGAVCTVVRETTDFWSLGLVMWECEFPRAMQWKFPPGAWSFVGDVPDRKLRKIGGDDLVEMVLRERMREVIA